MKQLLSTATFMVLALYALSQREATPTLSRQDYLTKSKNQKATAWVFIVGGAGLSVLGFTQINHVKNDPNVGFTESIESALGWAAVGSVGSTLVICSIPLFFASHHNARRAAEIGMNHQKIMTPQGNCFRWKSQPALTLKLSLSR